MIMTKYKIVNCGVTDDAEKEVNKAVENGWRIVSVNTRYILLAKELKYGEK